MRLALGWGRLKYLVGGEMGWLFAGLVSYRWWLSAALGWANILHHLTRRYPQERLLTLTVDKQEEGVVEGQLSQQG